MNTFKQITITLLITIAILAGLIYPVNLIHNYEFKRCINSWVNNTPSVSERLSALKLAVDYTNTFLANGETQYMADSIIKITHLYQLRKLDYMANDTSLIMHVRASARYKCHLIKDINPTDKHNTYIILDIMKFIEHNNF